MPAGPPPVMQQVVVMDDEAIDHLDRRMGEGARSMADIGADVCARRFTPSSGFATLSPRYKSEA
jgi:hypothetical protein